MTNVKESVSKILVKRKGYLGSLDEYLPGEHKALDVDSFINTFHLNLAKRISEFEIKQNITSEIKITFEQNYEYTMVNIEWEEEETDAEYTTRQKKLEQERIKQQARNDKEYAEYLRLKDKFECRK